MKLKFWIAAIFIVLAFLLAFISPVIGSVVSTNREFNTTQDSIFLNYTNAYSQNITLFSNASYVISLNISNTTAAISKNYSQTNSYSYCLDNSIRFIVRNASDYSEATQINISALGNGTINLTFVTLDCLPGRYYGGWVIKNSTNLTENLTISFAIDIPISRQNYITLPTTGTANLTASMPGNASIFHRYYFNTSEVNRSTSVTINLSAAQDLDIFLFNSTTRKLLARSANKSNSSEWLSFWPLEPNSIYEIRIYGNITNTSSTSYSFYMLYSTLNATYTADTGQPITNLSFGSFNTSMKNIQNITLINDGNFTMDSVTENKEIYYVKRWTSNISLDGLFLVPSFTTKIKVVVNWTNSSQNYSVFLSAPNKTVFGSSNDRYANANATNASLEEYFETSNIVAGYWNVSVRNNTRESQNNYTIAAYVWYPVSDWIVTNYTTKTFNTTGNNNSTSPINITLTASNNSIDGNYEGFVQYTTAQGAALRIPFIASVNTSSLIVNETLGSATVQIDENIGANLTKVLNITLNNTGSYSFSFSLENSTNNTRALWNSANYINFSYQASSSPLSAGSNHLINITVVIDPNTTRNSTGVYEGYLKFVTNDSRPYQNFTLTLRVNLTNDLNIIISQIGSQDGDMNWINQSAIEIFNASLNIYYINGTGSEITTLNTSNFTSAWLTSANISHRIPATGSLSISNGTSPSIYQNSKYNLNLTLPASQPGGIYQLHIGANYTRGDGYVFKGEGVYNYLYINQTGLSMSTNSSTSVSIGNGSTSIFYANVSNYGNLAGSSATIQFSESCSGYSVSATGSVGGCLVSTGTDTFTISPPANSRTCMVWWTITAGSSAADACTANIIGGGSGNTWYDTRGINVSVTITAPSSSTTTTTTTTSTTNTTTTTTNTTPDLAITSYPSETKITQNASAAVNIKVKNSGNVNLTGVKVYIDGINQSWYIQPAAQDIAKNVEKTYSITFNISASAPVATYSIKYVANTTSSYANKSVSASLVVIPSNQTAAQLVTNISNYTTKYEQLSLLLNQTKAKGANLTEVEASLKKAKDLMDKADAYIKTGDYFSAYQLIGEIDSLLKVAEITITEAKQSLEKQTAGFWFWIAMGTAAVVIIGIIIYLVLPPTHGFEHGVGYKYAHPKLRGKSRLVVMKEKTKEFLKKVKEKFTKKQKRSVHPYVYKGMPS